VSGDIDQKNGRIDEGNEWYNSVNASKIQILQSKGYRKRSRSDSVQQDHMLSKSYSSSASSSRPGRKEMVGKAFHAARDSGLRNPLKRKYEHREMTDVEKTCVRKRGRYEVQCSR
jgi:hypothetical protein